MRRILWVTALLSSFFPLPLGGARAEEPPEREILQLMELLEQWDVIQDLEVMRLLGMLEKLEETSPEQNIQDQTIEEPKDVGK